ncbi:MAG TPA: hypothetical protein VFL78_10855 [Rhodanobacteraceae bacterium]|nr:hypothetical protein [Rhodanobacteraceae bacterium]
MHKRPLLRAGLHGLFALLGAIAIALALGAIWMAVALHMASAAWWLALPVGLAMGYATKTWITPSRGFAMLLAAGGTWLAAIYMQCIFIALRLAAIMGLGLSTTLHKAGVGMLLALARASWDTHLFVSCLIGMLLALVVAGGRSRRASLNRHQAP